MNWRREEQLPSWNRRGGAQRRGGRWIELLSVPFVHWNPSEPFRLYYHPGPSGHPSCSRRGVVPSSPPIHSRHSFRSFQNQLRNTTGINPLRDVPPAALLHPSDMRRKVVATLCIAGENPIAI